MASCNRDQIEACLRVISNRCRNLRKAIDRAKTWQAAADGGQPLNYEQAESVRGLPRKEALLAELTEILKRQSSIVEDVADPAPSPAPSSAASPRSTSRSSKAAAKPAPDPDPKLTDSDPAEHVPAPVKEHPDRTDPPAHHTDPADSPDQHAAQSDVEPKSSSSTPPADASASPPRATDRAPAHPAAMPEAVTQMIAALELKHADRLKQTKTDSVRAALNLFHVVDYLRQEGSREALLAYFNSPAAPPKMRRLTSLDIDLLIYFNVMLTSPNGNVPHPEAVDVSTAHCLEFINNSQEEAFQDTSYATLVDIVNTIATCPILTDRSEPTDSAEVEELNKHVYNPHPQGEPGHLVEAASTKATVP